MKLRTPRSIALRAMAPLLAVAATACVLPDQMSQVQTDVSDLRTQVGEIRQSQSDTQREIEELKSLTAASSAAGGAVRREDMANIVVRLDRISREVSMTDAKVNDMNRRLDRFSQDVRRARDLPRSTPPEVDPGAMPVDPGAGASGTTGSTLQPVAPRPGAIPDPEALYNTAYLDFSKGNFDLAIAGFEEYQQRFAESPLADNALYWIGECRFSKGDFSLAIEAFDRLLERYARSDKAPSADLKKALAFQEQNLIGQAIVQLRYVISQYPSTDESRIARDKLSALGQAPS